MADHGPVPLLLVPLPPGVPDGIRVWHLPLCLERPAPDRDWALLSPAEVERATRLRQPADRVRAVCTRATLRRLLGEQLGMAASQVPLGTGPHGRPQLVADKEGEGQEQEPGTGSARWWTEGTLPDFNVSHSGACALIAVAEGGLSVGVDVERCDAFGTQGLADPAALESLVLSARERAAPPAARPDFPTLWTVKEAVLKCLGFGVAEHLPHVGVERREAGGARGDVGSDVGIGVEVLLNGPLQGSTVWARVLAAPPGYAAALAWTGTGAGTPR